jgi:hypothetical protein
MPTAKPIKLMQRTRSTSGGSKVFSFGLSQLDDLDIQLDSAALLDFVSTALAMHHRESILTGKRADGTSQRDLVAVGTQGQLAKTGARPNIRGNRGKQTKGLGFADGVTRSAIAQTLRQTKAQKRNQQVTVVARCTIGPHKTHEGFAQRELDGLTIKDDGTTVRAHISSPVEYFFVNGEAEQVIDKAVDAWLENLLTGKPVNWTKTEQLAKGMSGPARQLRPR